MWAGSSADGQHVSPSTLRRRAHTRRAAADRAAGAGRRAGPPLRGPALPLLRCELHGAAAAPRRNLFCVGRNYHAHAKELRDTVFKDSAKDTDAWPIVFTKVPECVIGPGRRRAAARRRGVGADRLRGRAGRGHRPRRPRHRARRRAWTMSSATPSSTTSPRATCRCATSSGTWARASTPSARWARGS